MIISLFIVIGILILIIMRLVYLFIDMKKKRNEAWNWYIREAEKNDNFN